MAQRLLNDDEHVLEDILRAFGPVILAVMSRRYADVLRETDIEDVISIGLFRLWTHRRRFDSQKSSLKVWYFRIVENAARDVLKHGWHKARLLEVNTEFALTGAVNASSNGHGDPAVISPVAADNRDLTPLQLDLRDIVAELPESQRTIILADAASKDGTASSQHLGEELNIPASTVRVYRKRALDRIRKELAARGHDPPWRGRSV
ncbi:MAG: sigma-70 family RNA polymerase sigma factor [Planctomycetaceae bacterium]